MAKKYTLESPSLKILMFDYLRFYNSIENIKTDKELTAKHPLIKPKVLSLLKESNLKPLEIYQIKAYDKNLISSNSFIYTGRSKIVNLLRHIRNSIAHNNITLNPNDNKTIIVKDYKKENGVIEPTCYGHITFAKFKELLKVKDL